MKTYKNLYNEFLSISNFEKAFRDTTKGSGKSEIRKLCRDNYINNIDKYLPSIIYFSSRFIPFKHDEFTIYEHSCKKERKIIIPTLNELILHHAVINVLEPIFMKQMYEHSYASISGRGTHRGQRAVQKWIRNDPANTKYFLKMDIKKFFESIDQEILINKLNRIIADDRMMDLLTKIIKSTDHGLPLGFYTSQWFANFYLTAFDHYVKEVLHAKYYIRYMDDMVIFDSNKRNLKKIKAAVEEYLGSELHVHIKTNAVVRPLMYVDKHGEIKGKDLDFLGFRFYRDHTTIRHRIFKKMMKKANKIRKCIIKHKRIKPTDAMAMLSYYGWIKHTNSHNLYLKEISKKAPLGLLKKIAGDYMRTGGKHVKVLYSADTIERFVQRDLSRGLRGDERELAKGMTMETLREELASRGLTLSE